MTQPTIVQSKIGTQFASADGTAQTVTFDSAITAGNAVVVVAALRNDSASSIADIVSAVALTGCSFTLQASQAMFSPGVNRGVAVWTAANVTGGGTAFSLTPTYSSGNGGCIALFELADVPASAVYEDEVGTQEYISASSSIGPLPASGDFSQADLLVFLARTFTNTSGATDVGFGVPSGWTERVDRPDGSGSKQTFWVGTIGRATATALGAVTITSSLADEYGQANLMFAIRGDVSGGGAASKAVRVSNINASSIGQTDIVADVFAAPTTGLTGSRICTVSGLEIENDGGVGKLDITHTSIDALATSTSVRVVARNGDYGFRGEVTATVVEL